MRNSGVRATADLKIIYWNTENKVETPGKGGDRVKKWFCNNQKINGHSIMMAMMVIRLTLYT
jgi:hypothetical protein